MYDEFDRGRSGASGKLVAKLSKSQKIVKKFKEPQKSKKFTKIISLEEHLPKRQASVDS